MDREPNPNAIDVMADATEAMDNTIDSKNAFSLTEEEKAVLELLTLGFINEEISKELGIKKRRVDSTLKVIFSKLDVDSRLKAAIKAVRHRIVILEINDETSDETPPHLTKAEKEILEKLAEGLKDEEIAKSRGIKLSSVRAMIGRMYRALHVNSRVQAFIEGVRWGLVQIEYEDEKT